jgi:hypothetical protein
MRSLIRLSILSGASALAALLAAGPSHAAVTISSAATQNMSCTAGVCTPTAASAVLNVGDLTNMLGTGSVTVNTGTGSLAAQVQDIVVAASFNWANASSLTLDAYRSVTFQSAVAVNGPAAVSLVTDDGGSGGVLSFGTSGSLSFLGTSNNLTINGKAYALVADLHTLASDIAANPSGMFALAGSYDASKDGTYGSSPISTTFSGVLDGLGNSIQNLSVSNAQKTLVYVGLFADVSGAVRNIGLAGVNISVARNGYVGALSGTNGGSISQVWATGTVSGAGGAVGGVVGTNFGTVSNSWASASIVAKGASAGGLVGASYGTIDSSYATGTVNNSANDQNAALGGLVGCSCGGTLSNSHATGKVSGGYYDGGLAGYNRSAVITNSHASGEVSAQYTAGGLVGYNDASEVTSNIEQTFATGLVSGSHRVGGLVGYNQYGEILNSYAEGKTSGNGSGAVVGGFVGWNDAYAQFSAVVSSSYSTGLVKATNGIPVGGFMGRDDALAGDTTNCYWDQQTSKQSDGIAGGNEPGVTGLTTRQFRSGLLTGFDPAIWAENPSINYGFPYLINNPPQ